MRPGSQRVIERAEQRLDLGQLGAFAVGDAGPGQLDRRMAWVLLGGLGE
jgi:hypothetical protein